MSDIVKHISLRLRGVALSSLWFCISTCAFKPDYATHSYCSPTCQRGEHLVRLPQAVVCYASMSITLLLYGCCALLSCAVLYCALYAAADRDKRCDSFDRNFLFCLEWHTSSSVMSCHSSVMSNQASCRQRVRKRSVQPFYLAGHEYPALATSFNQAARRHRVTDQLLHGA